MSTSSPMADQNSTDTDPQPATTTVVNTSGGSVIHGTVTVGDDFVGRDKIVNNYYGAEPKPPTDSQEAALFIPFLRKSASEFVGRDAELVELHEKLQQSQMVEVRPAAALTGLGGIGKTQLAVEYAYRYQASYPGGIYWINAADLNRVRSGLVETAERMGLRTDYNTTDNTLLAGLVKRCQQQPATLLCFDNAPDAVILWRRLTQELNTATLGAAILITTRRRDLPPTMTALDLRRLSDDTVRQLLEKARPNLLTDLDLPRLLERLGGLPLVVSLVANALQNSPDATIADYLAALAQHGEETGHEELDAHVEDYDLYREVYTRTLLPVLHEQWERLCQQPKSENAQLLLRIAGQLPEAAEIPIARLGLLAGLEDGKVIKPLTSAIQALWKLALIEELKADAIRLHPLVRNFAATITPSGERSSFGMACAQRLATAYSNWHRLGQEYAGRGIAALLVDVLTAIDLEQSPFPDNSSPFSDLQALLYVLRRETHHLQGEATTWQPQRLWQQMLPRTPSADNQDLTRQLSVMLCQTLYWLPHWSHQHQSVALEQTLTGHDDWVLAVTVVAGQRIVSTSADGTLKIWNLTTGQVEQTLTGHKSWVNAVAVVDGQRIVSASLDRTLKVWNLTTGQVEQTLTGHEGWVSAVTVADGQRIVSASGDRTLKVWNLTTGQVEKTFTGHEDSVECVAVVDGQRIVSGSLDRTLKVWNLTTGQVEKTFTGHEESIRGVAVVDEQCIVSCSLDSTLKVWNLTTGQVEQTLTGHEGGVLSVTVVDGQYIVSCAHDDTLKVWRLQTGQMEQTLTGHEASVNAMSMVAGQRIISASLDRTLKVWNLATSHLSPGIAGQTLTGHETWVDAVAVVDEQRIVSASSDGILKVWNLTTGQVEQTLTGHEASVWGVAVVDGQRIVSASSDRTLKIWNLTTGQVEQTLTAHEDRVNAVAVVDSQRIVSASSDRTLKVWNLTTGQVEQTLTGHEDRVNAVAVVDSQRIVSAADDRTLKVWNLTTGQVIASIGLDGALQCVAVTRQDGRNLVVAGDAGGCALLFGIGGAKKLTGKGLTRKGDFHKPPSAFLPVHGTTVQYGLGGQFLKLVDPHRGLIGKTGNDFQFTTHRLDKGTQGADIHIGASLNFRDSRLIDM